MMKNRFVDLTALADRHRTDKGSQCGDSHLYTEIYATSFESFRLQEFVLLELGLLHTPDREQERNPAARSVDRIPSIEMWLEYFPNATCYGFDLADFSTLEKPRFRFIRGDLSEDADIARLASSIPSPRIIIDDASHASFHQQRAFLRLFPILQPGGFYAIEDLHYSPPFESSLAPCRPMYKIIEEFLETGTLALDFASAEESRTLSGQIAHSFLHCSSRGTHCWAPKLVIFQKKTDANVVLPPTSIRAAPEALPPIDHHWLTSRMFSFRGGEKRQLYCPAIRFDPNGRIGGYRNSNETSWRFSDGRLTILRDDGVPSCIATPIRNEAGTVSFVGKFLLATGNVVHRFEENPADNGPPAVFSFDLFDTLVARRCYDPISIFHAVEAKSGCTGFARARKELESKLWQAGDYAFDDIYTELAAATNWSEATLRHLRMLELAEEWENLFPIRETVSRVRRGDLVVSDMYLPLGFVRRVVEKKCGLEGCLIHLSSHGKHRGEIWTRIRSTHRIMRHYGDNQHGDIESARRANLTTEHVTISRWTRGEQILVDTGLAAIARIVREARLSSFDADPAVRRAQLAQFELNIPLLIVASLYALQRAAELQSDTLLMCSRDCNLWLSLMKWLAARSAGTPAIRYFVASRVLLLSDSPEYSAYFSQMRGRRTMLLDVSGTGRSPAYFLGKFDNHADTSVLLLTGTTQAADNFVTNMAPASADVQIEILSEQRHEVRLAIESLNMSLEGRAHQIEFTGHSFEVQHQPNEFGPVAQKVITAMRTAFLNTMQQLAEAHLPKLPGHIQVEALRSAANSLIGNVMDHRRTYASILNDIVREEDTVRRAAAAERMRNRTRLTARA